MNASRALVAASLLGVSTACYVAVPDPIYTPCRITGSSDWRAEIDEAAGEEPRLLVSGKVTVPTGGYAVSLERGYVQELDPPRQQVIVRTDAPPEAATQAEVTEEVSGSFPVAKNLGGVTVRCGDKILAAIALPPRAQ